VGCERTSGLAKGRGEAEGLHDGEVGLEGVDRGALALLRGEDVAAPRREDAVDAAHGRVLGLDLDQVDGLHEPGLGRQLGRVEHATGRRDDLAASAVDGVGVEGHVHEVEAGAAHDLPA
jgi:hypothetical protein